MAESHPDEGRRKFLRSVAGGAILVGGSSRASGLAGAADPEDLVGSVRWPGEALRPRDFYNRYRVLGEWMKIEVPDDVPGYVAAWRRPHDRALARAEAMEKAGRRVTAADKYMQASAFSHREYVLYLRLGDAAKARDAYRRSRQLFDRGVSLAQPWLPMERVEIPYGSQKLKGLLVFPSGPRKGRLPVVYRTGGTDSTKEASYLGMIWAPFTDRGVACFMMDGPGQGEALNEQGIQFVADWERAVKAAFDHLGSRPDVDPARLGLWGQSTGGYFGARGAAPGTGAAAVVLQGAMYDLLEDCYEYCPPFRRHLRFMLGSPSDADARTKLRAFNLREIAPRIRVPISILHGTQDNAVRFAGAEQLYKQVGSAEKHFAPQNAARELGDSAPDAVSDLIDWLCARLGA